MEILNLDELSVDKDSEFLFLVAQLNIVRGPGSPLNPLAIT